MNYIIYDLEATCWADKPPGLVQEIIEIGAFKLDVYGDVLGSYNRFIKPVVNPFLSPFCKQLTSITQSDVDRANKFPRVIEEFKDWIDLFEEDYLLISWGSFDKKAIISECKQNQLEYEWIEDTHVNLKSLYQKMMKLRRPCGLKTAVKREGFEFTGVHHRGIDDAENLAKVFAKYLREWGI